MRRAWARGALASFGAGAGAAATGFSTGLAGAGAPPRVRFFSTTTALVRPWLKLCLTVEVSVFFSDSVLAGALAFVSLAHKSLSFRARKPLRRSASKISRSARPPDWTGGMYHILAAQRQAQFGAGKCLDHFTIQPQPMGGGEQFALAVGGTVKGFDQGRGRLRAFQRAQHIVKPQHRRAGAPRQAQIAQHPGDQRRFGAGGKVGGGGDVFLAAREKASCPPPSPPSRRPQSPKGHGPAISPPHRAPPRHPALPQTGQGDCRASLRP